MMVVLVLDMCGKLRSGPPLHYNQYLTHKLLDLVTPL